MLMSTHVSQEILSVTMHSVFVRNHLYEKGHVMTGNAKRVACMVTIVSAVLALGIGGVSYALDFPAAKQAPPKEAHGPLVITVGELAYAEYQDALQEAEEDRIEADLAMRMNAPDKYEEAAEAEESAREAEAARQFYEKYKDDKTPVTVYRDNDDGDSDDVWDYDVEGPWDDVFDVDDQTASTADVPSAYSQNNGGTTWYDNDGWDDDDWDDDDDYDDLDDDDDDDWDDEYDD